MTVGILADSVRAATGLMSGGPDLSVCAEGKSILAVSWRYIARYGRSWRGRGAGWEMT